MEMNKSNFSLFIINNAVMEKHMADIILSCNVETEKYGLVLNEQQALALSQTCTYALKETKRIEFNGCMVNKLILAFCNSPYITEENYEDILHELINLFYELKNNTWDMISDDGLLVFLKDSFNGECSGSIELVSEKALELSEHIHCGGTIENFKWKEV